VAENQLDLFGRLVCLYQVDLGLFDASLAALSNNIAGFVFNAHQLHSEAFNNAKVSFRDDFLDDLFLGLLLCSLRVVSGCGRRC